MSVDTLSVETIEQLQVLAEKRGQSVSEYVASLNAKDAVKPKSRQKLGAAIFNKMTDGILVINNENRYVEVNDAACEMLGYCRDEFLQLTTADLIAEDTTRSEAIKREYDNSGHISAVYRLRKKDGEHIYAEISAIANVLDNTHVAFVRDASYLVHMNRALEEAEQYVHAIYQGTKAPLFSVNVDRQGQFTYHEISPEHLKAFKLPREEVIGKCPSEIYTISEEDAERLVNTYRHCYELGKTITYEQHMTVKRKIVKWATRLYPLRDDTGRIYRLVGMSFDLSDKEAAQQERIRANILDMELNRAQELSRYKAQITSMLAHEFQTPLSVINTSIFMLKKNIEQITREEVDKRVHRIDRQVVLLRQLMERVIDLNHGAVMQQDLDIKLVDFADLVQTVIDDLKMSFPDSAAVHFDCRLNDPHVFTDRELMRQIINNLVSNALKYSSAKKHPITVSAYMDEVIFTIEVRDQGIGIPAEDLAQLGNFFQRGRNVENRDGIGIGLMVVKQAISRLGGKIDIQSEEGVGTTMSVFLPAKAMHYS